MKFRALITDLSFCVIGIYIDEKRKYICTHLMNSEYVTLFLFVYVDK